MVTLTHRNTLEGHPFPAFLKDVKTEVLFLRNNADKYQIDLDMVDKIELVPDEVRPIFEGLRGENTKDNIKRLMGLIQLIIFKMVNPILHFLSFKVTRG